MARQRCLGLIRGLTNAYIARREPIIFDSAGRNSIALHKQRTMSRFFIVFRKTRDPFEIPPTMLAGTNTARRDSQAVIVAYRFHLLNKYFSATKLECASVAKNCLQYYS